MAVNLSPVYGAGAQLFDNNGVPLSGGFIYTYAAGTSTPAATYTSSLGTIQNSNPIQLDAAGRPPQEIWLTAGSTYKFVLTDSSNVVIQTYDNLYKNVLVDNSSFTVYSESDKLYSISFTISMTDQVPSQSL